MPTHNVCTNKAIGKHRSISSNILPFFLMQFLFLMLHLYDLFGDVFSDSICLHVLGMNA